MKKVVLLCFLLISAGKGVAQDFNANLIPESLSKGSVAVVRNYVVDYTYTSPVLNTYKVSMAVTVMGEGGVGTADIDFYTYKESSLKSFSGEILDRTGKVIRKIKKSDLGYSEADSGLASDTKLWYYEPMAAEYPYTVVYEYEIIRKDGILSFPVFAPVNSYDTAVENAEFRLTLPTDTKFYIKAFNTDIQPVESDVKSGRQYTWTIKNLEPVGSVPFSPNYNDAFPAIYTTPYSFEYNKIAGTQDNWENYSKWIWKLCEGRSALPEVAKAKVKELTAGAKTDREKVEILHDFLGQTRYVSIQLGIGGLQPMSAADVYKYKYGDCKALSNYMGAMLAECGINSYYTIIKSGEGSSLLEDYVHGGMANHAILYVPLEGEDLWIECTNTDVPLGYTHSGITDRKALLVRATGGGLVDMPVYPDSVNVSIINADIVIGSDGEIKSSIEMTNRMERYERIMRYRRMSPAERLKSISGMVKLPIVNITNIQYEEEKSAEPWATVSYDLTGSINVSGTRGYLNINPFRNNYSPRLRRSRKMDIYIDEGYRNVDNIEVTLPEGFKIELLPAPINEESRFGYFRMLVLPPVDGKVEIYREMQLNKGLYSVEHYEEFKNFMDAIGKGNGAQIVIQREQ